MYEAITVHSSITAVHCSGGDVSRIRISLSAHVKADPRCVALFLYSIHSQTLT